MLGFCQCCSKGLTKIPVMIGSTDLEGWEFCSKSCLWHMADLNNIELPERLNDAIEQARATYRIEEAAQFLRAELHA